MSGYSDVSCYLSPDGLRKLKTNPVTGEGINWTADPTIELPIKISNDAQNMASLKPITVLDVMFNVVETYPERAALRVERNGRWKEWTYRKYYSDCRKFAKSLVKIGFDRHDCLNVIGFNSPEWVIADVGAILAGGIAAGIYTTNGPESCFYIADHSRAKVVVVEDAAQAEKFLQIKHRLPNLMCIIQWIGTPTSPDVLSWADFLALGADVDDNTLQERVNYQKPGHCCTLIYTSGTTGPPKAVMLSHDNITWTARVLASSFNLTGQNERSVSYLPLSHIAAQMSDIHATMLVGATVSFARPDALKGTLVDTLQAVRPTLFFGVPRVWEKIEERMRAVGAANTGIKKSLGDWAKKVGLEGNLNRLEGKDVPWGWAVANKVVFANVQKALGLDACNIRITGAAPITTKTVNYFMSLDMSLSELYGMSESSGPHTLNLKGATKIGSVGRAMPGTETKLDANSSEILMKGRHVMMGYMYNPEATAKNITLDGYLTTGDVGKIDADGFLSITGRIKELIITAGGENVPPVLIEDKIKFELPGLISNVMVVGEMKKYLACVVTLRTEVDAKTGGLTDKIEHTQQLLDLYKKAGQPAPTTVVEASTSAVLLKAIDAGIKAANGKATSRAQKVQKFKIVTQDFSVEGGELTPTMKLKRRIVVKKYNDVIESELYAPVAKL